MIDACMIDGFGWFKEADFRRSWLFFDRVDYILPSEINGPLQYPDGLTANPMFVVVKPKSNAETVSQLIEQSRQDAADPEFLALVKSLIPGADLNYATMVVFSDAEVRSVIKYDMVEPVFSLAYLVNKLLIYSAITGAIPVFGCAYATDIVVYKIRKMAKLLARQRSASIVIPSQMTTLSAIAAGLSLGFVHDSDLLKASTAELIRFKQKSFSILQRHQTHIIETSRNFDGLPVGRDFQLHLSNLRLEAKKQRFELDTEIRDSWLSLGLSKTANVITSSISLLGSALGLTKLGDPTLAFSLPVALANLGITTGMSQVAGHGRREIPASSQTMLYLFEAQKYLNSDGDEGGKLVELAIDSRGSELINDLAHPPTGASLRRLIVLIFPTDSDFMAFCLDFFPSISKQFGNNMDRQTKMNILFQSERAADILKCLREFAPEAVRANEHILEY
jgi:hypothetical protein